MREKVRKPWEKGSFGKTNSVSNRTKEFQMQKLKANFRMEKGTSLERVKGGRLKPEQLNPTTKPPDETSGLRVLVWKGFQKRFDMKQKGF